MSNCPCDNKSILAQETRCRGYDWLVRDRCEDSDLGLRFSTRLMLLESGHRQI